MDSDRDGASTSGPSKTGEYEQYREDDPSGEGESRPDQIKSRIQAAATKVKDVLDQVVDEGQATLLKMTAQANDAYTKTSHRAQKVGEVVGPFTKDNPYAALGAAALAGLVIGLIMGSRNPRVVYISPRS